MKKIWIFLLAIVIVVGGWIAIDKIAHDQLIRELKVQALESCIKSADKMLENTDYNVHALDFDIKEIRPVIRNKRYIIYIDWYVNADTYFGLQKDREHWMFEVSCTMPRESLVNGKKITVTYMDDNYNEGCNLIYNNTSALNGFDYHEKLTGKNDQDEVVGSVRCSLCGNMYRSNSTFGMRVKKGMPCGLSGCGK